MFNKEEAAKLRTEFWTSFGKSFPRKWLLYRTKIKGFSFKFAADHKIAMIVLDIESNDAIKNELLFIQIEALKNILTNEYLPEIIFDPNYELETGKRIFRIYSQHPSRFNIYNKNTWRDAFTFFNEQMHQFELFYLEYEDFIKSAI
ncbi:MAG: hypothetical protein COB98_10190 [Flavobacteriaceae bacterium]|nr:MAG: hypothetical protein COB98_10190 [Flavobacteriaceae bacterium]